LRFLLGEMKKEHNSLVLNLAYLWPSEVVPIQDVPQPDAHGLWVRLVRHPHAIVTSQERQLTGVMRGDILFGDTLVIPNEEAWNVDIVSCLPAYIKSKSKNMILS
jgi:hypothetical protein